MPVRLNVNIPSGNGTVDIYRSSAALDVGSLPAPLTTLSSSGTINDNPPVNTGGVWYAARAQSGFQRPLVQINVPIPAQLLADTAGILNSSLRNFSMEAALNGLWLDFQNNAYWLLGQRYTSYLGIPGAAYTRSGTRFAGESSLTSFAANVPRIVTGSGIRVTSGATNLLQQSQTFNAPWNAWPNRVSTTEIAPDGTATASYVRSQSGATGSSLQAVGTFTGSAETFSIFLRQGDSPTFFMGLYDNTSAAFAGFVRVDWSGGVPSLANVGGAPTLLPVQNVGGGWWRVAFSCTGTAGNLRFVFLYPETSGGGSGLGTRIWGAQLETGSTPSDYIPTTSSSASAGADSATVTLSGFNYPLSVISLFSTAISTGARRGVASVWNTGSFQAASHALGLTNLAEWASGGSPDAGASISAASITLGAVQRVAGRMVLNDVRGALNGTLSAQDVTASVPTTPNQLAIGSNSGIGHNPLEGWVGLIAILPRALSDSELTNGTA